MSKPHDPPLSHFPTLHVSSGRVQTGKRKGVYTIVLVSTPTTGSGHRHERPWSGSRRRCSWRGSDLPRCCSRTPRRPPRRGRTPWRGKDVGGRGRYDSVEVRDGGRLDRVGTDVLLWERSPEVGPRPSDRRAAHTPTRQRGEADLGVVLRVTEGRGRTLNPDSQTLQRTREFTPLILCRVSVRPSRTWVREGDWSRH